MGTRAVDLRYHGDTRSCVLCSENVAVIIGAGGRSINVLLSNSVPPVAGIALITLIDYWYVH